MNRRNRRYLPLSAPRSNLFPSDANKPERRFALLSGFLLAVLAVAPLAVSAPASPAEAQSQPQRPDGFFAHQVRGTAVELR